MKLLYLLFLTLFCITSCFLLIDENPYLLVVSFYTKKRFHEIDQSWIEQVNQTPYNGIAVMMHPPYSSEPLKRFQTEEELASVLKNCKKDIWPWIFFNRFVGGDDVRETALKKISNNDIGYFRRIPGLDLCRMGNFCEFKEIFRKSLRISKKLNSPGILIDHEAYNNYQIYKLNYLAKQMNSSTSEIRKKLLDAGEQLAEITLEEYPTAVLWFYSTAPHISTSIIAEGILKAANEHDIPLKVIDGGENTIRYVNQDINELEKQIANQKEIFAAWKSEYEDRFHLGATIAPTHTSNQRTGWIKNKYANTAIKEVDDLLPHLRMLLSTHQYILIYAASATQFNPFDPIIAAPYHKMIKKSIN